MQGEMCSSRTAAAYFTEMAKASAALLGDVPFRLTSTAEDEGGSNCRSLDRCYLP